MIRIARLVTLACALGCATAALAQDAGFGDDPLPDVPDGTLGEERPFIDGEPVQPVPEPPTRIRNRVAVFSGLDKITGRITEFDVYVDETVQFGVLQVTPRVCWSRPQTEQPKTSSFIEVNEITLDRKMKKLFSGWVFAESPGLNAIEHPVNDVWLKACKQTTSVAPPPGGLPPAGPEPVPQRPQPAAPAAASTAEDARPAAVPPDELSPESDAAAPPVAASPDREPLSDSARRDREMTLEEFLAQPERSD